MTEHDRHEETGPPDDRELEEFLAGRSPLSRAHREGAQEQAPPELDARVLQAAREELRRARPAKRLLRWDGPLALAASTLLVVGLAWLVHLQLPRPGAGQAIPAAAPVPQAPAAASAPQQKATLDELKKQKEEELPSAALAQSAAPPAAAAKESLAMPQAFPAPARKAAKQPPAEVAAPSVEVEERTRAKDVELKREEGYSDQTLQSAPAPELSPPAAMGADNAGRSAAPAAGSASSPAARVAGKTVPDPCASPQRAAAQRQALPERHLDATAWLKQIRRLRDAPDSSVARAELACFVARHPELEPPEDLRPLLQ